MIRFPFSCEILKKKSTIAQNKEQPLEAHAVILAGGRGTRFWPRSRLRTPKQLLNIVGQETMFEQTVARLLDRKSVV